MKRQQGQAAVEFALIAPIVFMMIFGMIWGGMMFTQYMHYSNALRTAVREIAVSTKTDEERAALILRKKQWLLNLWKEEISIPLYEPTNATTTDEDGNTQPVDIIQEKKDENGNEVVIVTVAFRISDATYATLPNILKWLEFPPKTLRTMQYQMQKG